MKFSHDLSYDADPAQVRDMLADPAFREQVCQALDSFRHEVSVDPDGAGMEVSVDQTQPAHGIPSFAKKFVGDEIRIVQHESWSDGSQAELSIEIPGKPGRFDGTISLDSAGPGTTEVVAGELRVKIPVVGGRLEGLVADLLHRALDTEERVGKAWLAGDR
jgi:hypothetical protein